MSPRLSQLVLFAFTAALSAGCADRYPREVRAPCIIDPQTIQHVLDTNPVREDEPFRPHTLLAREDFSMHLLQFRTGERRHIHRRHDLTFFVLRGEGEVYVDDIRHGAQPGSMFHIPRRVPHYAVNAGAHPLVALLVFTPKYDLKDSVPVEAGD